MKASSIFLSSLVGKLVSFDKDGRPIWELQEDLIYYSERFGLITVPKGFRTNYASVPRLPVIFLVAGDRAHAQAAVHDFGYTFHEDLTRDEWDYVFYESLGADLVTEVQKPVPDWLARVMYSAVQTFGQRGWDSLSTIVQQPDWLP